MTSYDYKSLRIDSPLIIQADYGLINVSQGKPQILMKWHIFLMFLLTFKTGTLLIKKTTDSVRWIRLLISNNLFLERCILKSKVSLRTHSSIFPCSPTPKYDHNKIRTQTFSVSQDPYSIAAGNTISHRKSKFLTEKFNEHLLRWYVFLKYM